MKAQLDSPRCHADCDTLEELHAQPEVKKYFEAIYNALDGLAVVCGDDTSETLIAEMLTDTLAGMFDKSTPFEDKAKAILRDFIKIADYLQGEEISEDADSRFEAIREIARAADGVQIRKTEIGSAVIVIAVRP